MNLKTVQELRAESRQCFRGPSVYVLFDGEQCIYVGKSVNFMARIGSHTDLWSFDSYAVIPIADGEDIDDVEKQYIAHLNPIHNRCRLSPSTAPVPDRGLAVIERVMMRVSRGQSIYSASKDEGVSPSRIYGSKAYRAWKNEADKLLLHPGDARPSQNGFRDDRNVEQRIYQARNRRSAEEAGNLK